MKPIYFMYPHYLGDVYRIGGRGSSVFDQDKDVVHLLDGTRVKLILEKGCLPRGTKGQFYPANGGAIWGAQLVLRQKDTKQHYGDRAGWNKLVPMINAAAAVNILFTVRLTQKEYMRLMNGGLYNLERRLSSRSRSMIRIMEDTRNGGGPALELLRTGRCP